MDKNSLNFRVIEKQVKNLEKILFSIPYAILAKYDVSCSLWTYLTFKGPLFLVQDKQKQKKIVILNQSQVKNYILSIQDFQKFEVQTLKDSNGYMLNWMFEDSIQGMQIYGIWTTDEKIKKILQAIKEK